MLGGEGAILGSGVCMAMKPCNCASRLQVRPCAAAQEPAGALRSKKGVPGEGFWDTATPSNEGPCFGTRTTWNSSGGQPHLPPLLPCAFPGGRHDRVPAILHAHGPRARGLQPRAVHLRRKGVVGEGAGGVVHTSTYMLGSVFI